MSGVRSTHPRQHVRWSPARRRATLRATPRDNNAGSAEKDSLTASGRTGKRIVARSAAAAAADGRLIAIERNGADLHVTLQVGDPRLDHAAFDLCGVRKEGGKRGKLLAEGPCASSSDEAAGIVHQDNSIQLRLGARHGKLIMEGRDGVSATASPPIDGFRSDSLALLYDTTPSSGPPGCPWPKDRKRLPARPSFFGGNRRAPAGDSVRGITGRHSPVDC